MLVATGRMFRSVEPYLAEAGIREPVVCYQGAAVVDPTTGQFLLHEPIELAVAREAIAALAERGFSQNVYVDDRLYVVNDNDTQSFISAFDTRTGNELWRVDRDEGSNWATPCD